MPRPPKAEGITIGFLGTGVKAVDPATDLIEEYINQAVKPDEPARFVFPLTTEEFSDSLADLARMARKSSITYEVISHTGDRNRKVFTEVANSAAKQYYVAEVWTQMELILNEAPQSALFVLWDDKREEELAEVCSRFMDAGIPVLDLTNNLIPLTKDEEEQEEAADEPEADEEEEAVVPEDVPTPMEEVMSDGAQGTDLYTRAQMEGMSHAQVKDIAVGMGLAPRKARDNMIIAILERQGTPEAAVVAPVGPQGVSDDHQPLVDVEALQEALDGFRKGLAADLEEFRLAFASTIEGLVFNMAAEKPMEVDEPEPEPEPPQPGRRRLLRS